jgi:hypothetical protein
VASDLHMLSSLACLLRDAMYWYRSRRNSSRASCAAFSCAAAAASASAGVA